MNMVRCSEYQHTEHSTDILRDHTSSTRQLKSDSGMFQHLLAIITHSSVVRRKNPDDDTPSNGLWKSNPCNIYRAQPLCPPRDDWSTFKWSAIYQYLGKLTTHYPNSSHPQIPKHKHYLRVHTKSHWPLLLQMRWGVSISTIHAMWWKRVYHH